MIKEQAIRKPLPFGKAKKSFDAQGFAKRYGLFVLLSGGFIFAMLTPLIFVIKKPYYEVHALMQVDPVVPTLLVTPDESSIVNYYERYANTVSRSMTTFDILKKTLDTMPSAKREKLFPKGMSSETCATLLEKIVTVTPVTRTHVLDIMISGGKSEGLAEFINTLMLVYMETNRKSSNESNTERLKFLYAQKNIIVQELSSIEKDLDSLTQNIGTSSYSESFNISAKNSEDLSKLYNAAMYERISAEAGYNSIRKSNAAMKKISQNPIIDEIVMSNSALMNANSWTYQQLQELRNTTDGLTPTNPDRTDVEDRMKSMKNYARELQGDVRKKAMQIVLGKRDIDMQKATILAKYNYDSAKIKADSLKQALETNLKDAKRISIGIHRGEYLSAHWKHKFDMLNDIEKRITEIEVEKKAPLRLSVLAFARNPNQPLKSNVNNIISMMFLGSFGLVAGGFVVYEFLDDTIRRDKDILHALGYPPTQTIGNLRTQAEDNDQFSIAPDDFRAHQIGSLAVKFCREKELEKSRIILFTGTDKGVGSTAIAFSCAKALGNLVPKVLVIDADIETSPVEATGEFEFNLPGLCDYLDGKVTLEDGIVRTPGDNIDIMYAGNISSGRNIPRQKIPELIRELKNEYDFVCIDGAPLLESHLVEQIAIFSDIVALISLGDSSKFQDLRRSAELLVRLGVPGIAPILNFGGNRKTLSLVEMFDNPPEILRKLLPDKLIDTIKRSPSGLEMIDRLLKIVQKFQQKKG